MTLIPEAKKKTTQASRYGDVPAAPPVSDPTQLDITQLQPGQKQQLEIKLVAGEKLSTDVKKEIHQLETAKKQAVNAKNIMLVDEITGLQDQLKKLEKKISARITALKKQLKVVPPDVTLWLNRIQTDCAQYLKQVKKAKRWLYRGSSGANAFVAKSWQSREPKDSNREAQILFDQMLATLGFVALRSNSIFTTSDFWHTKEFGDRTYVIFPVDGASHYTYTNQADLVLDNVSDVGMDQDKVNAFKKELLPYVEAEIAKLGKKKPSVNLQYLRKFASEKWPSWESVVSYLQAYVKKTPNHGIPARFLDPDIKKQLLTPEGFEKQWKPKQDNLALALKNEWEVYVSGTYYALSADAYGDFIAGKFGVQVESSSSSRSWY